MREYTFFLNGKLYTIHQLLEREQFESFLLDDPEEWDNFGYLTNHERAEQIIQFAATIPNIDFRAFQEETEAVDFLVIYYKDANQNFDLTNELHATQKLYSKELN